MTTVAKLYTLYHKIEHPLYVSLSKFTLTKCAWRYIMESRWWLLCLHPTPFGWDITNQAWMCSHWHEKIHDVIHTWLGSIPLLGRCYLRYHEMVKKKRNKKKKFSSSTSYMRAITICKLSLCKKKWHGNNVSHIYTTMKINISVSFYSRSQGTFTLHDLHLRKA